MTTSRIDRLFQLSVLGLAFVAAGGLYWIFIAESWWARLDVFFGVGGFALAPR